MQMKTFLNSWRAASGVEDRLLSESRKSDAYDKYPFLKTHIDSMIQNDPSDNNKYLPYFTKVFGKDFKSELERIGRETYERSLDQGHPEGVAAERGKRLAKVAMINNAEDFIDNIMHFHDNSAVYDQKDIFSYKTREDLKSARDGAEHEIERRDMEKRYAKQVKNEVEVVYSDHNIIIRRPESHRASALYGLGAQWCISERDNEGYWNDYENGGNAFYFLELKNNPPRRNLQKFAFQYHHNGLKDIYDEKDDSTDREEVSAALHIHLIRASKNKKALQIISKTDDFYNDTAPIINTTEGLKSAYGSEFLAAYNSIVKETYGWEDIESMYEWVEQIFSELEASMEFHVENNPPGPNWEDLISEMESKLSQEIEYISWNLEYLDEDPPPPHYIYVSLSYRIESEIFEDLDWLEEDYDYDDDLSNIINDYGWDITPDNIEVYNGEVTIDWSDFDLSGDISEQLDEFFSYATTVDNDVPGLFESIVEELEDQNLLRTAATEAIETKIKTLKSELNNFDIVVDGHAIYAQKTLEFDYDAFYATLKKRIDVKDFTPFGFGPKNILPAGPEMNQTVAKSVTAYYQKLAASLTTADSKQIDMFGKDSPQTDMFGEKDHTKYNNPVIVSLRITPYDLHEIYARLTFRIGEFKKTEEGIELIPKTSMALLKFVNDNETKTMLQSMFEILVNASITINLPAQEKESLTENKRRGNYRNLYNAWKKFLN